MSNVQTNLSRVGFFGGKFILRKYLNNCLPFENKFPHQRKISLEYLLLLLPQCAAWPGGGLGQGDCSGGRQVAAGGGRPRGPAHGGEHTAQTHADQNIHSQGQAESNGFRRFGRQEINMSLGLFVVVVDLYIKYQPFPTLL